MMIATLSKLIYMSLLVSSFVMSFRFRSAAFRSGSKFAVAMSTTERGVSTIGANVQQCRELMAKENIDAFIVPTDDPHMSEYTAPHYMRREFISGFTGSAGTAVITKDNSYLFTDGRYHNQAELELEDDWVLMKQGLKDVPTISELLRGTLSPGATVGVDPLLHSAADVKKMFEVFKDKDIKVSTVTENPVDAVWNSCDDSRPSVPLGKIRVHPAEYAGKSVTEKLAEIRGKMQGKKVGGLVSSALDEIAWLYNIRGCDIPCNPVSIAYSLVTNEAAYLFVDSSKLTPELEAHFAESGITVKAYEDAQKTISEHAEDNSIWMDGRKVNFAIYSSVPVDKRLDQESPITLMKACKNAAELKGMHEAHRRDGAAVAEFFCWLEKHFSEGGKITEVEIDDKITGFRAQCDRFLEPSFPTIAGVAGNGAIIHYRAVPETCKTCEGNDLILLDSGGQYLDGTTDVTRTFHTGTPTDYQKEMFTRVLKGNIAVDQRVFPIGTAGCLLDSYAREHLWSIGKDFIHGVGHGVGAALNVHEGPHSISRNLNVHQALVPGMIVSNEPGYYETGNFGIRIENLLVVTERPEMGEFGGRGFLGFEKLTLIPIQKKMINKDLLSPAEVQWLNEYHKEVREKVSPYVRTEEVKKWLEESTSEL